MECDADKIFIPCGGVKDINWPSYAQEMKFLVWRGEELEFFYCQNLCDDVIINFYLRAGA